MKECTTLGQVPRTNESRLLIVMHRMLFPFIVYYRFFNFITLIIDGVLVGITTIFLLYA